MGQAVQPELGLLQSLAGPQPLILGERWRKIARLAWKLLTVLSGARALGSPCQAKVLNTSEDRRHFSNADGACIILQKPTPTQRTLEVTSPSLLGHHLGEYSPSSRSVLALRIGAGRGRSHWHLETPDKHLLLLALEAREWQQPNVVRSLGE